MDTLLKQPPATDAERKLHPLAYGIERIGLVSLRFPYLFAAVLTVAAILAAFGIGRIQVDDLLSQLFRSEHAGVPAIRGCDEAVSLERI